jgi:predicted PurR-regulated permease PerM
LNSFSGAIRRHWRLLVFILGLILVFWLLWVLLSVILPFIVGLILAYLLLPAIRWVEKRWKGDARKQQIKRVTIIVVIYLLALAFVGAIVFYIIAVLGKSLVTMVQDAPNLIPNGLAAIADWLKSLAIFSSPSIQQQIDVYSAKAGAALSIVLTDSLLSGWDLVKSSSGMILGFAIMPVFTFYILKDWCSLRDRFFAALPLWTRKHTQNVFHILQNVVVRYIRGQLILGLVVAVFTWVLLFFMKIDFALPLAVFGGIMEMVPMIGPWLGGGLAVLVTLAVAPDKVIWVVIGVVVIQLLENILLVPKIQSMQMQIHPALIIVLSILGSYLAGVLGFIIILPLTMFVLGLIKYFRDTVREGRIA